MTAHDRPGVSFPARRRSRWLPFVTISMAVHAIAFLPGAPRGAPPEESVRSGSALNVALAAAPASIPVGETALQTFPKMEALKPRTPKYAAMLPVPSLAISPPEEDDSSFLPRKRLTVPPVALREIDVPYPANAARAEPIAIRLMLLINADGSVANARVVTPFVPPQFSYAARQAFLAAAFRPGEVDGVPVKSRMVVEVSFSSNDDGKAH
jgi:hypothetical protein